MFGIRLSYDLPFVHVLSKECLANTVVQLVNAGVFKIPHVLHRAVLCLDGVISVWFLLS